MNQYHQVDDAFLPLDKRNISVKLINVVTVKLSQCQCKNKFLYFNLNNIFEMKTILKGENLLSAKYNEMNF